MKNNINLIGLVVLICFSSFCFGQEIPKGGAKMLGPYPMKNFELTDATKSSMKQDGEVLQLTTLAPADNTWDLQISARSKFPTQMGDVMLIVFEGRMISSKDETGKAMVNVVFERAGPNYDKSLFQNVALDPEWKTYYLPFKAQNSFDPGEAQINFQIGFKPQQLEIKNLLFYNYQKRQKLEDLPKTKYTYDGRELTAKWREKAAQQIDKYRKADITFNLTDKKGTPLTDLTIEIEQQNHAFGFGTAVDATTFNIRQEYRDTLLANFNKVVFENDLKWPQWDNPNNKMEMFKALAVFNKANIPVRGHVLVWPGWRWLPYHAKALENDPKALQKHVLSHIKDEMTALEGKLAEWDVLNEPFTNTDLVNICGEQVMTEWFNTAHATDPKPTRYINDFSIIGGGGTDLKHQDHYYNTIKYLVDNNAPVEGIGFQSHFGSHLTPPEKLWSILDRYAEFGLEMQVTEFDIDIDDEELQADYTRDFLTAIFAYPKMKGLMVWGFWENRHWRPNAAMYTSDWTPKPNAQAWKDLIYKEWWTKESVTSNSTLRAFLGDYKYTVKDKKGNIVDTGVFQLSKEGYKLEKKIK